MLQNSKISPYAECILEEFTHLHFIAFNDNCLLAVCPKTSKAHFFYEINEDLSFHFNMLCEVGSKTDAKAWFEKMIKDLHYDLRAKETETDYFDTLIQINS